MSSGSPVSAAFVARRIALAIVALSLLVAAFAVARAHGADDAGPPHVTVSEARGSLRLENSREGQAVLSAERLVPGEARSGEVAIWSSRGRPGELSLLPQRLADVAGTRGGMLSRRLRLQVVDRATGATVYAGRLAAMPALRLGALVPRQIRRYRFTILLPEGGAPASAASGDNVYQGASLSVTYQWRAEEREVRGVTLTGTSRADVLVGTPGNDVIRCGAGNDVADGRGGNDRIYCGSGDDLVRGGPGNDQLFPEAGRDRVEGGTGDDLLVGWSGEDVLLGGPGANRIIPGSGRLPLP